MVQGLTAPSARGVLPSEPVQPWLVFHWLEFGRPQYFGGRYEKALTQLNETLAADCTSLLALWGKALVLEQLGKPKEVIAILQPLGFATLNRVSSLGHAYAIAGRCADARTVLDTLESRAKMSYVVAITSRLRMRVSRTRMKHSVGLTALTSSVRPCWPTFASTRPWPRSAPIRGFTELVRSIGKI